MKLVLDHNPLTGETVYFGSDSAGGQVTITHEQDVTDSLRLAHHKATDVDFTRDGIRNDMWHYAHIPNVIAVQMKQKYGVDVLNRDHDAKVFDLLNTEYKAFKTTTWNHVVKNG